MKTTVCLKYFVLDCRCMGQQTGETCENEIANVSTLQKNIQQFFLKTELPSKPEHSENQLAISPYCSHSQNFGSCLIYQGG